MIVGTATISINGPACRYCGCNCMGGTGCAPTSFGNWQVFVIEPMIDRRQREIDALMVSLKRELTAYTTIPGWVIELLQPPRHMKRFPRRLEGPRQCHFNSRPRHRRLMRIKRLWRSSCRSLATAAGRTPSRNGVAVNRARRLALSKI